MVNILHLLAHAGAAQIQKRQVTSTTTQTWSDIVTTSYLFLSEPTTVGVAGYYGTVLVPSGGVAVVSTFRETTFTTREPQTYPLLSPSPLDAACTSALSAYSRSQYYVTAEGRDPTFQVGFDPTCLPSSYYAAAYYSPGICPSGYTIGRDLSSVSTAGKLETIGKCCYSSYTYLSALSGCVSYLNPALAATETATPGAPLASDRVITAWTVVAEYTSVSVSSTTFSAPRIRSSSVVTTLTTSRTRVQTLTTHAIVSGDLAATIVAPDIWIRWAASDQFVVDWLSTALSVVGGDNGTTPAPVPVPQPPPDSSSLSGGAIAGIAIGAVAGLALVVGALVLCLRRRKQRATAVSSAGYTAEGSPETGTTDAHTPVYVETVFPKSELDSKALTPEQYATQSPPQVYPPFVPTTTAPSQYIPYHPPPSEIEGTEIHATTPSITGVGAAPVERARSPSEWTASTTQPEADRSSQPVTDPGAAPAAARSSVAQLEKLKEERARLQRLQEIAEQEARLEAQIERELAEERGR